MDAGKINSLIHTLRGGEGGARTGNPQGDAAFAAKIAAAVLVDDLLQAAEGEPHAGAMVPPTVPPAPRTGVVVNLSTGVVAAEMAARLGNALPRPADQSNPRPDTAVPSAPARVYALTERLAESSRVNVLASGSEARPVADERRATEVLTASPAAPQAEIGTNVFPLLPPPGVPMNRLEIAEHRSIAATAIEQARESERLAGLNAKGEASVVPRWLHLDRLVLAAIVLGLALVILL